MQRHSMLRSKQLNILLGLLLSDIMSMAERLNRILGFHYYPRDKVQNIIISNIFSDEILIRFDTIQ